MLPELEIRAFILSRIVAQSHESDGFDGILAGADVRTAVLILTGVDIETIGFAEPQDSDLRLSTKLLDLIGVPYLLLEGDTLDIDTGWLRFAGFVEQEGGGYEHPRFGQWDRSNVELVGAQVLS